MCKYVKWVLHVDGYRGVLSWRYYRRIVPGRELKADMRRHAVKTCMNNQSVTALCTRETRIVGYNLTANTNSYANTQDREEAEHHGVHFSQLPAHRMAGLEGLKPPQGVGGQVVRTPPPADEWSQKRCSSCGAPVWNCVGKWRRTSGHSLATMKDAGRSAGVLPCERASVLCQHDWSWSWRSALTLILLLRPYHSPGTAQVALAFAFARVPDQESDNNDSHSSSDHSHQKRCNVNARGAWVCIWGLSQTTTELIIILPCIMHYSNLIIITFLCRIVSEQKCSMAVVEKKRKLLNRL